jgi:hypothetical protein
VKLSTGEAMNAQVDLHSHITSCHDTSPLSFRNRIFKSHTARGLAAKFLITVGFAASGHFQEEGGVLISWFYRGGRLILICV